MEDKQTIAERLQANSIIEVGKAEYNAVLRILVDDIRQLGAASINLDSKLNEGGIEKLLNLNLSEIQSAALKPFYDEMCELMNSETPDIKAIGRLYDQAKLEEALVTEAAYESIISEFDDSGFTAIENRKEEITANSTMMSVNWEGVASDLPEYSTAFFHRLCQQHLDPSSIPEIDTEIERQNSRIRRF